MAAPLTLALTQFLWFVLPTLLELHAAYQIPQTRYSSGILAVLIPRNTFGSPATTSSARRAPRASELAHGDLFPHARRRRIALFIPGPWLVSRLFHFDFTTSFLIFTAIVNIHHFILDGQFWKLRDSRICGHVDRPRGKQRDAAIDYCEERGRTSTTPAASARWFGSGFFRPPRFAFHCWRCSSCGVGWTRSISRSARTKEIFPALRQAALLDPYDSMLAGADRPSGGERGPQTRGACRAHPRRRPVNPYNAGLQHALARALNTRTASIPRRTIATRRCSSFFPRDADALVNYGLLAARFGHPELALDFLGKSRTGGSPMSRTPSLSRRSCSTRRANLPLRSPLGRPSRFADAHPDDPAAGVAQQFSAGHSIRGRRGALGKPSRGSSTYLTATRLRNAPPIATLESLALVHLADLQEKSGRPESAANSYQRGLELDGKADRSRAAHLSTGSITGNF